MITNKIIFFLPALESGGVERFISELSLNLPDTIEKIIVLFKDQAMYPYDFKGKIISLNLPFNNSLFFKVYYFFAGIMRLKKIISKEQPDCVISFGFKANLMNIFSGSKNIIRADACLSLDLRGTDKLLAKIFFPLASQVVCVSMAAKKDLVDNFRIKKDRIKVIYNPLNIKKIKGLATEELELKYKKVFDSPVIINVGRFAEQKGQWHLLKAFKEVKKEIKDAKLVFLGEGRLEQKLKILIKELGLENDVYFLGWQSNPFKFLSKAKVFVSSSLWEGMPYVILEAMACGLPVVSVDCKSGPREILAPNTSIDKTAENIEYGEYGILTPAFDGKDYNVNGPADKNEKILKSAIIEILKNKKMADDFKKKSLQRLEDFTIPKIIKQWL